MKFTKVHELGSDYILFDARGESDRDWSAIALRVCSRHTGVGADGVLVLLDSDTADVRMRRFDANGGEPEPDGSGVCALARYAFENGVVRGTSFTVETSDGILTPHIVLRSGRTEGVRIDLGLPQIDARSVPVAVEGRAVGMVLSEDGRTFSATALRLGAPHTIVFLDAQDRADVSHYGPLIECDPLFPERTHVGFCEVLSPERIRLRTWKRGCGCTLSYGASAGAAIVACALNGKTGRRAVVDVALGTLHVEWSETDGHVYLIGSSETVCSGIWNA